MASLAPIRDADIPKQDTDYRTYWRVLRLLCQMYNALLNFQINASESEAKLTISESNATLDLLPGGGSQAAADDLRPCVPYLSPTATGPNAPFTIRIRFVTVNGAPPGTPNIEIVVPPNSTDGYYVWLAAVADANGNMLSFDYGHGTSLPAAPIVPTDGSAPAAAYDCIFVVTSTATGVTLPALTQLRWTPLSLVAVETNQTLTSIERKLVFTGEGGVADIPA